MKTLFKTIVAGVLCAGVLTAAAAEKKVEVGAKGGRLLDKTEPRAEFVVEKDHNVTIHFYGKDMKAVAATTQTVTVIADAKGGRETLVFEKKGDALVSKTRLPAGDGYNVVVQFRQTAEAKPQNFRFKLDLHVCGGCQRAEYACYCHE
jgi:hypothetical protein